MMAAMTLTMDSRASEKIAEEFVRAYAVNFSVSSPIATPRESWAAESSSRCSRCFCGVVAPGVVAMIVGGLGRVQCRTGIDRRAITPPVMLHGNRLARGAIRINQCKVGFPWGH